MGDAPTTPCPSTRSQDDGLGEPSHAVGSMQGPPDDATLAESDVSDHEEAGPNSAPPSKKRKGQRFFCTDFPPCNLSFTRSEHLARHIRKHTGERPFQCHCQRRFSRLDNLRQHAQTVHVNEDIPGDSLAATGTRFQRQIRTDRVRSQARARVGPPNGRGHSRHLSAPSATTTAYHPHDIRRRPPPLIMADEASASARMSLDSRDPPPTPPGQPYGMPGPRIGSPYTPSHVYSAGPSHVASPMSAHANFWDSKATTRRLSVPNAYSTQQVKPYPSYGSSPSAYTNSGGTFASPTSSNFSASRDDATEVELRRRTWPPALYSGQDANQTPETLQPRYGNGSEQQIKLPGIESFDKVSQPRALTPVRETSPMHIDQPSRPPLSYSSGGAFNYAQPAACPPPPVSGPGHRRGHFSWDPSMHRKLTANYEEKPALKDASFWSQQTIAELQNIGSSHQHGTSSGSSLSIPVREHRVAGHSGWQAARPSPEDSSSSEGVHTPSTASLEYHPAIVHNSGYVEPHQPMSSEAATVSPASPTSRFF